MCELFGRVRPLQSLQSAKIEVRVLFRSKVTDGFA
jgi:hypothetical protein